MFYALSEPRCTLSRTPLNSSVGAPNPVDQYADSLRGQPWMICVLLAITSIKKAAKDITRRYVPKGAHPAPPSHISPSDQLLRSTSSTNRGVARLGKNDSRARSQFEAITFRECGRVGTRERAGPFGPRFGPSPAPEQRQEIVAGTDQGPLALYLDEAAEQKPAEVPRPLDKGEDGLCEHLPRRVQGVPPLGAERAAHPSRRLGWFGIRPWAERRGPAPDLAGGDERFDLLALRPVTFPSLQ